MMVGCAVATGLLDGDEHLRGAAPRLGADEQVESLTVYQRHLLGPVYA
jgi:hypothetical protein